MIRPDRRRRTVDEHFSRGDGSSGFGDIRAGIRCALAVKARQILVGGLAIKAPTGEYRVRDSEGEINEPTIQPVTGSTDVIGSPKVNEVNLAPGAGIMLGVSHAF